jgi:hypothetical protein
MYITGIMETVHKIDYLAEANPSVHLAIAADGNPIMMKSTLSDSC